MGKVFGVIGGLVALFVIVVVVQMLGPVLHPIPAGLNPSDNVALAAWIATAPYSAKAVVIVAWLLGALGGGWIALRISGWVPAAWIIATLGALMALATIFRFEHPLWMQVGAVVVPFLGGWLAIRLRSRQPVSAPLRADAAIDG